MTSSPASERRKCVSAQRPQREPEQDEQQEERSGTIRRNAGGEGQPNPEGGIDHAGEERAQQRQRHELADGPSHYPGSKERHLDVTAPADRAKAEGIGSGRAG